jgi:hypothetical protein
MHQTNAKKCTDIQINAEQLLSKNNYKQAFRDLGSKIELCENVANLTSQRGNQQAYQPLVIKYELAYAKAALQMGERKIAYEYSSKALNTYNNKLTDKQRDTLLLQGSLVSEILSVKQNTDPKWDSINN